MKKLKIWLVFISIYAWRFVSLESPLPPSWTPDSLVRFTATIIDEPSYTDTKTVISHGLWSMRIKGYAVIMPGSKVSFAGKVKPTVLLNKVVKIEMVDPTFEVIKLPSENRISVLSRIRIWLGQLRASWVNILEKSLPEPMSSLAAGILLGIKAQMPQEFYQNLVNTGTLHIIAASGYNVSIVAQVLLHMTAGIVSRGGGIAIAIVGILLYTMIAGGTASVVRSAIMGGLTLVAYYFGRPSEARRLLYVCAGLMLVYNPLYLLDIGFQLSFAATAGLLYLEPAFKKLPQQVFLAEYLYPTLAASLATLPIILYHFGRVSYISPLVNMLVLSAVPLIMGLTAIVVGVGMVSGSGAQIIAWILYPLLWYMVTVISWWG